jgi:hypothetical protein
MPKIRSQFMPKNLRIISLAALFPVLASAALASEVTEQTPCSVAIKAWDGKDIDAVRNIGLFVENTMQDLDFKHTDNGEPGIMAGMTDHVRATAVATAVGFCRQHPRATIYNEAASAYQGLRDIEVQFGLAK